MIFLRGRVPTDRDPSQIMFDDINNCDDMWTQLSRSISNRINKKGEIWYWGGERTVQYEENFTERWIKDFSDRRYDFATESIFARGGFEEYDQVLNRFKDVFTIYYGAGFRYFPRYGFKNFNLILVDTPEQKERIKNQFQSSAVEVWAKPACDNIFSPVEKQEKEYDVIMVGNYNKGVDKGHDFAFQIIPKNIKVLSVGIVPKYIRQKYNHIHYTGWVPRKKISEYYAKSKVSIICCGKEDSCPRVISESLASNCPILVLDRVNVWKDKYINNYTGLVSSKEDFVTNLRKMLQIYKNFIPYSYYKDNLSLNTAVSKICSYFG